LKGPAPVTLGPTDIPFADPIIKGDDPNHWHLAKGRSFDNGTYVAYSNQCENGMMGLSGILGYDPREFPRPEVWASTDKEEVIAFTTDTTSSNPDFPSNPPQEEGFRGYATAILVRYHC
jgi:predicted amidohydrolase